MDELMKALCGDKTQEEVISMLVNLNRFQLDKKDHIKKYNRLRKLHSEIIDSMQNYIASGKYDFRKYDDIVNNELMKVVGDFDINFDLENDDDITVFLELFVYSNHPSIPSVTDIYLKNNKFKSNDKIKMLECMQNSYVGLFKVIDVDRTDGYVIYQDVFTKKEFKTIDIALSSSYVIDKQRELYIYNRIITWENISFSTGIHCNFSSNSKLLMDFIKSHNYKDCCSFIRCLLLYDIYKRDDSVKSAYNNKF